MPEAPGEQRSLEQAPRAPALFVGRRAELERFAAAMRELRLALVYGVAGVGKTSLMLRAAEALAERLGGRVAHCACRAGESTATVAAAATRQLRAAAPPTTGPRRGRNPVEELTREAVAQPVVLCIDDAQRAANPALFEALAHLAARRLPLWVFIASRESLDISPAQVDHLVLRLGALPPEDTRALWDALEHLYGPAEVTLDEVTRSGTGNPLLIKQAFGGARAPNESDAMGLEALPPGEAEVLAQVCTFRRPVPRAALLAGGDPQATAVALRRLARRFLLESPAPGLLAVHDLVRDAVERSSRAPGRREHAACLAHYDARGRAAQDESLEFEELHHAVACGEDERALGILMAHASRARPLLPVPAAAEHDLAHAIDQLAARRPLPALLRLLRARIRVRQGDVVRAEEEALAVAAEGEPLAEYDLGEMAYMLNRLDAALLRLRRAAADQRLSPVARAWACLLLVEANRSGGDVDEAERILAASGPVFDEAGPIGAAVRCWAQGMLAHDCEDYATAAAAMTQARRWLERPAASRIRLPLLATQERVIAGAMGRPRDPEVDLADFFDETLFIRLAARLWHAEGLFYAGDMRAAASLADETLTAARAAGYRGHEWWGLCIWGEAARTLGRTREVMTRLEAARAAAAGAGLDRDQARLYAVLARTALVRGEPAVARTAAAGVGPLPHAPGTRARLRAVAAVADAVAGAAPGPLARLRSPQGVVGFELAEWRLARTEVLMWDGRLQDARREAREIERLAARARWRWLACRARLLGAEATFRLGAFDDCEPAWAGARAEAEEQGYAAERALAALLGVALSRTRGELAEARRWVAAAAACAAEAGLELEAAAARIAGAVLDGRQVAEESPGQRLARRLGLDEETTLAWRDHRASRLVTRGQLAAIAPAQYAMFIDLVRGRVHAGRRVVDLTRRKALLQLLQPLAARPGTLVPASDIVRQVWAVDYHPLRHQGRLHVAISRLRQLLGPGTIESEGGGVGYRLAVPSSWAVVEPLAAVARE